MKIELSDHFTYKKLFIFTLPPILMMIFTSIYSIVDGFFVSNYVGEMPFTAVNFIMPFLLILGSVGFLFGSGGSALIAKTLGEGDNKKANMLFSLFVYIIIISGVVFSLSGIIFIRPIALLLGASEIILDDCVIYGRIILSALPFCMLQYAFQTFFVTAEKPILGFMVTLIAGFTNIILDALFVAVFKWGIAGAAIATAVSQAVGGIVPLIYFFSKNKSLLRLGKTRFDISSLLKASSNGMSEFLSNITLSLIGMLYNAQLMKYAGENGVAAYGTVMYVGMIFFAVFGGYSMGTAPVIGFHYGAENSEEVKSVLHKSLKIIGVTSVVMLASSLLLACPLSTLFVGYNKTLTDMTVRAFDIYSFVFLFAGIPIFSSSFFTALNNGFVSALISFLRTAVFQVIAVLTLPLIWETDGIWISCVVADFAAVLISVVCLIANGKKYKYSNSRTSNDVVNNN